ncbi:hypothetical protein ACBJ59_10545 [Nonomuraea sp. MTCD27]|uniref:hypothetical protein n=1 Tax=Nonomuraea sp. MTCD27 TaxID=1676747 RepID=UPI0035C05FFC
MRHLQALRQRVGRRGAALLFFALLDIIYAASLTTAPPNGPYLFLDSLMPLSTWASIWACVGGLCAIQAFVVTDRVAFAAASALKVVWGLTQLLGWMFGEIPRGYVAAAVWLAFAAFVQVIAGWQEPPRRGV